MPTTMKLHVYVYTSWFPGTGDYLMKAGDGSHKQAKINENRTGRRCETKVGSVLNRLGNLGERSGLFCVGNLIASP